VCKQRQVYLDDDDSVIDEREESKDDDEERNGDDDEEEVADMTRGKSNENKVVRSSVTVKRNDVGSIKQAKAKSDTVRSTTWHRRDGLLTAVVHTKRNDKTTLEISRSIGSNDEDGRDKVVTSGETELDLDSWYSDGRNDETYENNDYDDNPFMDDDDCYDDDGNNNESIIKHEEIERVATFGDKSSGGKSNFDHRAGVSDYASDGMCYGGMRNKDVRSSVPVKQDEGRLMKDAKTSWNTERSTAKDRHDGGEAKYGMNNGTKSQNNVVLEIIESSDSSYDDDSDEEIGTLGKTPPDWDNSFFNGCNEEANEMADGGDNVYIKDDDYHDEDGGNNDGIMNEEDEKWATYSDKDSDKKIKFDDSSPFDENRGVTNMEVSSWDDRFGNNESSNGRIYDNDDLGETENSDDNSSEHEMFGGYNHSTIYKELAKYWSQGHDNNQFEFVEFDTIFNVAVREVRETLRLVRARSICYSRELIHVLTTLLPL